MAMQRTKVISDIHGCDDEFSDLMKVAHYNPDAEQLVLLGDYIDRGPKSRQVVARVMQLVQEYGAIALGGNHEDMLLTWLQGEPLHARYPYEHEIMGGTETIQSYLEPYGHATVDEKARLLMYQHYADHIEFLHGLPDFYEDEQHIFVHAGINPFQENWKDTPSKELRWIRDPFHKNPHNAGKTVIFGHTPTFHLHEDGACDPWYGEKIIGVDGGCVFGNQLICFEIGEDGYNWYAVPRREIWV